MAHAYTPGLVVSERTLVTKRRLLPIRGDVLVARGSRVDARQVVARTELPGNWGPTVPTFTRSGTFTQVGAVDSVSP